MAEIPTSRKRQHEDVETLEELQAPRPTANVHAAIKMLSPIKKGKTSVFFDGTIADGTSKMRIVGFSPEQQKKLLGFHQNKKPINIVNCEIKPSRQDGDKMEVMLKNATRIQESAREIDSSIFEEEEEEVRAIKLHELGRINNFQRISADVAVLSKSVPVVVSGGKKKQDVIVADSSGTSKVTVWEYYVDSLEVGSSYSLLYENMLGANTYHCLEKDNDR